MAKKIMINVHDAQKEHWVKAAHEEMVSLSEWIRRACDARLRPSLERLASQPLTDKQIKDAAEGFALLAQQPVSADSEDRSVKGRTIGEAFTDFVVANISEPGETSAIVTTTVAAELPVEDAGTAPVSVPTATPRLTPEQSSLQAALHEQQQPAKQFKPDFKAEAKPKKPRR